MFEILLWKPLVCLLLADVTAVYHANPGSPVVAEPRVGAVPLLHGRGEAPGQVSSNGEVGTILEHKEQHTKLLH